MAVIRAELDAAGAVGTAGEPLRPHAHGAGRADGALWVTTSNTDGRGEIRDGDDRILRFAAR